MKGQQRLLRPIVAGLLLLPSVLSAAQAPTGGLRIVSPPNGTIVEPGQPFTVIVEPVAGITPVAIALVSPSIFTFTQHPPFTFAVAFPIDAPLGPEVVVATGKDTKERDLRAELTLQVETARPVSSIQVRSRTVRRPASVSLIRGLMEERLSVDGTFIDGTTRDISKSREIQYISGNPQVATVTPDGLVKAVGEGTTTMTVTYKGQSTTVPVKVEFERRSIKIDVLPGTFPNRINVDSQGVIPVAILTIQGFDATRVDPLSVRFGPNGAAEVHGRGHVEDVDSDGVLDMMFHFSQPDTGIHCLLRQAVLTGVTIDGVLIRGVDSVLPQGKLCG